jgi:hypothetical protein
VPPKEKEKEKSLEKEATCTNLSSTVKYKENFRMTPL